jgi:hypothetical protein
MVDERKNWEILYEFLRIWERPAKLEGNDQIAIVPCQLSYGVGQKVKHVSTVANVFVKEGRVVLSENDWLNPFEYYSEFSVRWQTFSITDGQALRIEGYGPKLGKYWIEVMPKISN